MIFSYIRWSKISRSKETVSSTKCRMQELGWVMAREAVQEGGSWAPPREEGRAQGAASAWDPGHSRTCQGWWNCVLPRALYSASHQLVQTKQQKGYWGDEVLAKCPPSHFSWGSRIQDKLFQPGCNVWDLGLICVAGGRGRVSSTATCWRNWPEGAFLGLHSPVKCPGNTRAYLEKDTYSIRERLVTRNWKPKRSQHFIR